MQIKSRSNQMIELFRGILSLMVVFCHFHIQGTADIYVVSIARCAVPFFLILSGYYAYTGDKAKDIAHAKKKLRDILKLVLRIAIVYTVVNTAACLISGEKPFMWFTEKYLSWEALRNFLLFNRARFFASVAYYLFMMLYVLTIYLLVLKIDAVSVALAFIPLLLAANLTICEILKMNWFFVGNWMLTGLPFFLIGVFLRKKSFSMKRKWCICLMAVGFVSSLTEAYIHQNIDVYLYFGTILLSTGNFLFCQTFENEQVCAPLVNFGNRFSLGVFLYHCATGYILTALFNIIGIPINSLFPFEVIVVTILVVALCKYCNKAMKRKKNKEMA